MIGVVIYMRREKIKEKEYFEQKMSRRNTNTTESKSMSALNRSTMGYENSNTQDSIVTEEVSVNTSQMLPQSPLLIRKGRSNGDLIFPGLDNILLPRKSASGKF
eukprot:TRINITY_DN6446_c0_g2_i1.p1 TRINITY_DN6446_c0_g2~~TRINITY_DN6446_c0_g2_i1.p1  ORF type:complete len:104 (-),score=20.35 TRINITY_DN6446_c0_g2_i1:18-329(-)